MDIRFNIMANLIRAGAIYLIKVILFGEENEVIKHDKKGPKKDKENRNKNRPPVGYLPLHIPRTKKWIGDHPIHPILKKESREYWLAPFQILKALIRPFIFLSSLFIYKEKDETNVKKDKPEETPTTDLEWAIEYCKGIILLYIILIFYK